MEIGVPWALGPRAQLHVEMAARVGIERAQTRHPLWVVSNVQERLPNKICVLQVSVQVCVFSIFKLILISSHFFYL